MVGLTSESLLSEITKADEREITTGYESSNCLLADTFPDHSDDAVNSQLLCFLVYRFQVIFLLGFTRPQSQAQSHDDWSEVPER